jgi:hypothetical protein
MTVLVEWTALRQGDYRTEAYTRARNRQESA